MIITGLVILILLLWLGYHLAGALLSALIWLCIKLPCAIIIGSFGIMCCALIVLIPIGLLCFHWAWIIIT